METNLKKKDQNVLVNISGPQFALPVCFLPMFAFLSCVGLSLVYDFEDSTATHCRVRNYLPSISAAIGGFTPQRYIWRICIGLHSWPRLLLCYINYKHYTAFHISYKPGLFRLLLVISTVLNVLENLALVTLTMVSSTENYGIHENSFIMFMGCSLSYMLLTSILFKWSRSPGPMNAHDSKSFKFKWQTFLFNITSFIVAVYFFVRHNTYCEPGIYTLFAFGEYLVVLSNIAFHTYGFHLDFTSTSNLQFNIPGRCITDNKHL